MDKVGVLVVSKCLSAPGIIETFSRSGYQPEFYVVERQSNPLSVSKAKVHAVVPDLDVAAIARFAKKYSTRLSFGLTDTEDFIIAGGRDLVEKETGVPVLCVTSKYAMEKSKADQRVLFQELFKDANPRYAIIDPAKEKSAASAVSTLKRFVADVEEPVIKPDAPARGAGVGVWGQEFTNEKEMVSFFRNVYSKGRVVVEERIEGEESSFQAFSDGRHFIAAPQTRDYKRALDNDGGKLTGGMGSYRDAAAHLPFLRPSEWASIVTQEERAFRRWKGRGSNPELKGIVLYDALMHAGRGFKILERNSRGGNTEQLCLFSTLQDDPVDVYFRMSEGLLKGIRFSNKASVITCAVPLNYGVGGPAPEAEEKLDLTAAYILQERAGGPLIYPMDLTQRGDAVYLGTSRSVAVVGTGESLEAARGASLSGIDALKGPVRSRRDIASQRDVSRSIAHERELRRKVSA